jgi:hypothetical protein
VEKKKETMDFFLSLTSYGICRIQKTDWIKSICRGLKWRLCRLLQIRNASGVKVPPAPSELVFSNRAYHLFLLGNTQGTYITYSTPQICKAKNGFVRGRMLKGSGGSYQWYWGERGMKSLSFVRHMLGLSDRR